MKTRDVETSPLLCVDSQEPQRTLAREATLEGIGLHRGEGARAVIRPADAHTGIVFVRDDLGEDARVAARARHVIDTRMCTTLGVTLGTHEVRVQTVEHLLSALYGLGIDNAYVHVHGSELPILDGSAAPIVEKLSSAGVKSLATPKMLWRVVEPVEARDGDRVATLLPAAPNAAALEVRCTLDFDHPLIASTPFVYRHSEAEFVRSLCRARTFGFLREVEMLRRHQLALGGSFDNAVVFDDTSVKTPGGLRFVDECARHKVLDALGDLSLTGVNLLGRLHLHRSGHALHVALARAVEEAIARSTCQTSPTPLPLAAYAAAHDE